MPVTATAVPLDFLAVRNDAAVAATVDSYFLPLAYFYDYHALVPSLVLCIMGNDSPAVVCRAPVTAVPSPSYSFKVRCAVVCLAAFYLPIRFLDFLSCMLSELRHEGSGS